MTSLVREKEKPFHHHFRRLKPFLLPHSTPPSLTPFSIHPRRRSCLLPSMGKRKIRPSSTSSDGGGGATVYPIFVDTNLDTHLALIVSDTDTVSDLKRKIKLEHPRCFPVVGKVKIKALQVKRRGRLYHLSDSMLVKSAFGGAKKNWFVYVDASSSKEQSLKQHLGKPDSSKQLALPWVTDCPSNNIRLSKHHESSALHSDQRVLAADQSSQGGYYVEIPKYVGTEDRYKTDNHWRTADSDSNKRSGLEVQKYDTGSEGIVSKKRLRDMERVSPMEGDSEFVPAARKKRKTKRNECCGNTFEKDKVLICGTTDVTSKADGTNQEIFCVDKGKRRNATSDGLVAEAIDDDHFSPISVGEKKKKNKKRKDNSISVKPLSQSITVVPEVQEVEEKRTLKENVAMDLSKDKEDEKEVFPIPIIKELHDLKKNGNHSAENNLGVDDQMFEGDKVDKCEQNKDVLLSHDPDVKLTEKGEHVNHGDNDASYKEPLLTSKLSDPKSGMESENVVGRKKKRKTKKSSSRNEIESVLKDVNENVNHVSVTGPNPAIDVHLTDETRKEGSVLSDNEVKETSEEKEAGAEKVISNEPELSLGMTTDKNQSNAEHLNEKSRKKSDSLPGSKRRKDSSKKCASRNENESVVKHDNDDPCAKEKEDKIQSHNDYSKEMSERKTIESHMTAGGECDNLLESGAEILQPTDTNGCKLDEDVIVASKECEIANGTNRKKKKKVKKSTAKEEDASVMKLNTDTVIESTSALPNPASDDCLMEKLQKDECVPFMEATGLPEEKAVDAPQVPDDVDVFVASKECEIANGTNRKKKKKVKKSTAKEEDASVMKLNTDAVIESTSAVPNPASDDCSMEKLQKDECAPFMEATGLPEEKAVDAPRAPDEGSDDVIGKDAETLQSSGTNRGQESVKDKSRSRRKKSQSYSTTSYQGFPTQEQEGEVDNSHLNQVDKNQEYAARTDRGKFKVPREVTVAAKSITSGLEQVSGLELESGKSNGIEQVPSPSQKIPMDVCLSEVPPSPVVETIVEADNGHQVDTSNGEGERIDFKQYFVPGENHNEGAPNGKAKEANKPERLMKSKKNQEKVDVPSVGTSRLQQKSLLSANNHADLTSQTKFITNRQSQKPLSLVENNKTVTPSKKSAEVSVDETKAPNSHTVDQFKTPKMARQSNVVYRSARDAKRNNGSLAGSSSNSDSSVRSRRGIVNNKRDLSYDQSDMAVGKTSAKNTGEVVNNSQRMKSLLATPGTIFGDDSGDSSADDNEAVDSDASTRTPSDKSFSSESEGESDSSLDSGRNGSNAAKGKGRRSYLVDSQSSEMKDKSFGEILRSSSRFKKAKVTASQYQEDTEDIDFVPESQPIS